MSDCDHRKRSYTDISPPPAPVAPSGTQDGDNDQDSGDVSPHDISPAAAPIVPSGTQSGNDDQDSGDVSTHDISQEAASIVPSGTRGSDNSKHNTKRRRLIEDISPPAASIVPSGTQSGDNDKDRGDVSTQDISPPPAPVARSGTHDDDNDQDSANVSPHDISPAAASVVSSGRSGADSKIHVVSYMPIWPVPLASMRSYGDKIRPSCETSIRDFGYTSAYDDESWGSFRRGIQVPVRERYAFSAGEPKLTLNDTVNRPQDNGPPIRLGVIGLPPPLPPPPPDDPPI